MKATHLRCKNRIQSPDKSIEDFKSINAAKRASRQIGLGKIRNVPKLLSE